MTTIALLLLLVPSVLSDRRIIGGEIARAGQFPFSAAIYKTTPSGNYFCGGALIHKQYILTAGQCVDGATLFTIYLGTNNIKTLSNTTVKVATDEYILHPGYNATTLDDDVGLIKLRMPVELSAYISTLDPHFSYTPGGSLEAIGWGQTSDSSSGLSDELHYVSVRSMSNSDCQGIYGDQIAHNMVCIVGQYNEGACTGDSGSPLIILIKGVMRKHFAISSFVSPRGCESTDPSGYTRVNPYVGWIDGVINAGV